MIKRTSEAFAAWQLNDGLKKDGKIASFVRYGEDAQMKWGVWLNSVNFGRVLDFSTEGSYAWAKGRRTAIKDSFTLSAWTMIPPRENEDRVILAQGEQPYFTEENETVLLSCTENEGWRGLAGVSYGTDLAGVHYVEAVSDNCDEFCVDLPGITDLSAYRENGIIKLDVFIDDVEAFKWDAAGVELIDENGKRAFWKLAGLNEGYNVVSLKVNDVSAGDVDFSKIKSFRLYDGIERRVTMRLSSIRIVKSVLHRPVNSWRLFCQKDTMELAFEADGICGLESSGYKINDGKWHHVCVSYDGATFIYYVDGEAVKTLECKGSALCAYDTLWIGGFGGIESLDGSMAQAAIYAGAKKPCEITDTVCDDSLEPVKPRLNIKKGLTLDRRQLLRATPLSFERQTVTLDDIDNIIAMGFDHVKLLLTPNQIMAENGDFIEGNLVYYKKLVDYVISRDYICLICLHPERRLKPDHLCENEDGERFEKLVRWYGDFARYIRNTWDADHVVLQLMTESGANVPEERWSWMSDRIWGATRNELPDHTLITSCDRFGNIERLKLMSPASDTNLIYSYTSYEPYTIGWYWYGERRNTFWKYIKDIPYPVLEGVDYTDEVERIIAKVPDDQKAEARRCLTNYVKGIDDGGHGYYKNYYAPHLYNRDWHFVRAKSLDDWRQKYGGKISIMVVEWGCMDRILGEPSPDWGISDEKRLEFTKDTRESLDAYDIGWTMWSYNEAHTVFKPGLCRKYYTPTHEEFLEWYDKELIEDALGLTPNFEYFEEK